MNITFAAAKVAVIAAVFLGLFTGSASATGPIPGVDIIVLKKPGDKKIAARTGADGTYQFKELAPGTYDLSVGGEHVKTITVGANETISGVLSRQPDGKASINFNGQVGVVPGLAEAKKANSALQEVPSTRRTAAAPGTGGGDDKMPRILRVINNSESDTANVETSNRDHIDQDAQTDLKKRTAVQTGGPEKARVRISADVPTLRVGAAASGTKGGDVKPGISDQGAAGNLSSYSTAAPPGDFNADGKPDITVNPVNDASTKAGGRGIPMKVDLPKPSGAVNGAK